MKLQRCFNQAITIASILFLSSCTESVTTATKLLQQLQEQALMNEVKRDFDAKQVTRGHEIFIKNCAVCHGQNGEGTADWRKPLANGRYPPPPLDSTAHAWHHSTEELKRFILKGGPPGKGRMPEWQDKLSEQEIDDILVWIKSLWSDEIYEAWYRQIEHR